MTTATASHNPIPTPDTRFQAPGRVGLCMAVVTTEESGGQESGAGRQEPGAGGRNRVPGAGAGSRGGWGATRGKRQPIRPAHQTREATTPEHRSLPRPWTARARRRRPWPAAGPPEFPRPQQRPHTVDANQCRSPGSSCEAVVVATGFRGLRARRRATSGGRAGLRMYMAVGAVMTPPTTLSCTRPLGAGDGSGYCSTR